MVAWPHRFTPTKVFIRVRVGTIEQGIILKGFEEHLKYNWGPEEEGRFKDEMKVFQHREYGTIWGKKGNGEESGLGAKSQLRLNLR